MIKKVIIFLLLFNSLVTFAVTYTVTSSADSGAGTLRDIIDNYAVTGDSIIFTNTISTITLTSGRILIDNGINIDGGSRVTIDGNANSRIFKVTAANVTTVLVENITLRNAYASGGRGGGAVYNVYNEHITISNCVFTGNVFSRNGGNYGGGAIFNRDGYVSIVDCVITNNSVTGSGNDGGGVLAGRGSSAQTYIDNCIIKDNYANQDGGGVFINNGYLCITNNTEISDNSADDDGGGVCINSSSAICLLYNGISFYNNSSGDNGGAIFTTGDTEITVSNCVFYGNHSEDYGGGICAYNTEKINIYNSVFTNNFSNSDSGGAFFDNLISATTLVYNCEFDHNYSPHYGGAIYYNGYMEIIDSEFYNNEATNRAGAAYIRRANISNTEFTNNITVQANGYGGGAVYTFGDTTISNCNFLDNSANANGGACRVNGSGARVNIIDCIFRNNFADNGSGGAVQANLASYLTINDSQFYNNNSSVDGGAIWAGRNYLTTYITNSIFDGNNAGDDAGTAYLSGTSSVINCRMINNYAGDNGGAIACFESSAIGEIINCDFLTNVAHDIGGAAYLQGNWLVNNAMVVSNTANFINGGGFYFAGGNVTTASVYNSTFKLNSAMTGDGGGLYVSCVFFITNSLIDSNTAADTGGGLDSRLKFVVKSTKIINNYAANYGGGVYNSSTDYSITSLFYNSSISNNSINTHYGGGVFQNNTAVIYDKSIIASNYSGNFGGGICGNSSDRSIIIISNSTIKSNYSIEDGGGIFCGGYLLIYGSCLAYNTCQNDDGGALYKTSRAAVIINSTISTNTAGDNGGGIYLSTSGKIDVYNSTVANNSSVSGGIYKDGGSSTANSMNLYSIIAAGNSVNDIAGNMNIVSNCVYQTVGAGTWTTAADNLQTNPMLKALGNYGGVTETHGLGFQSPAINAGLNFLNLNYDQRSVPFDREIDTAADAGSYEAQLVKCTINATPTNGTSALTVNFTSSIIGTNSTGVYYYWDFDNDGNFDTSGLNLDSPSHTYTSVGLYSVKLLVSNLLSEMAVVVNTNYIDVIGQQIRYVATNGLHISPFDTWANAATNIQAAVDVSRDDYLIIVSNGTYFLSHQVIITNKIYLESYKGPGKTLVVGTSTSRCIYASSGANISGFTFSNGYATSAAQGLGTDGYGGGVYLDGSTFVTNCVFDHNYAATRGGGVYCNSGAVVIDSIFDNNKSDWRGAGVFCDNGGLIMNSVMQKNNVDNYGGGICLYQGGTVSNSIMKYNNASGSSGTGGGGAECYQGGEIYACEIYENTADNDGAGVLVYNNGNAVIDNCIIRNNNAGDWGGGVTFYYTGNSILRNCLIINNFSDEGGGVYGFYSAIIQNCTIARNSAFSDGGGVKFEGTAPSVINSIVYNNTANDTNHLNYTDMNATYTCTYPELSGTGNITNSPIFVDLNNNDFHISTNSPCVNAGSNQAWMSGAKELDGNDRIIGASVDMGCYELGALICSFVADKTAGARPLTVNFTSFVSGTNTTAIYYYWDFDNNGVIDSEGYAVDAPTYTYTNNGTYTVKLIVSNIYSETAEYTKYNYIIVADPRYVAYNGKHISPFQNWENAASNIQAAVDISEDNMTIIVSNGYYFLAKNVTVTNAIKIKSYAGKDKTFVVSTNRSRAFYLTKGASIHGFTVSNCYAAPTDLDGNGGAIFCYHGGSVSNCVLVNNVASSNGGAVFLYDGGTVNFSLISSNKAEYGGGVAFDSGGYALNCIVSNNYAVWRGGGIYDYNQGIVRNSLIVHNFSRGNGGGISFYRSGGLAECCTICSNSTLYRGGGFYSHDGGKLKNSIIVYNSSILNTAYSNWYSEITSTDYGRNVNYCDTAPLSGLPTGSGNNIDSNPQFLSIANNNFRLQPISPCIDSGDNSTWMTNCFDLDGNPRIINFIVNIGAYESTVTPVIFVDNPPDNYVFPFRTINFDFMGRAVSVDGNIWYTNNWPDGIGYDFFTSAEQWTNNIILPKYGDYIITFYGTNTLGNITNATIHVTRKRGQIFMFR